MTNGPQRAGLIIPTPIFSNEPNSFAWGVLHRRHPALIEQVRAATPYPPNIQAALDRLLDEVTVGTVGRLPAGAHDRALWDEWGHRWYGEPWDAIPFLWAESYFYRRLLEAVGYFEPGPWNGLDPFGPQKSAELLDPSLSDELATLDELASLTETERLDAYGDAALWGNRADLGFRMSDPAAKDRKHVTDLVVDQRHAAWAHLYERPAGTVRLVADNAGRELLPDLVLSDHLLRTRMAGTIDIHLKAHPYYISDATTADLIDAVRRLRKTSGEAGQVGERLQQALADGRMTVDADQFYCTPLTYRDLPNDLARKFANATLTIMKGDLNYRRLVGDMTWSPTESFAEVTSYFPGPVLAMRTLKSDVVVGLRPDTLAALDATDHAWRTSGTHGLCQVRL